MCGLPALVFAAAQFLKWQVPVPVVFELAHFPLPGACKMISNCQTLLPAL
jgi:hypothetical protein